MLLLKKQNFHQPFRFVGNSLLPLHRQPLLYMKFLRLLKTLTLPMSLLQM
jgi:hypothetical protein